MARYIQIITATGSREEAEKISRAVVERRLAGCAQVLGPATSIYRWEGKVERAEEWLCLMKSRSDLFTELASAVRHLHSYRVPEILAMPVEEGNRSYLDWLEGELKR